MKLLIGTDKIFKIDFASDFVLLDDGPIIDALTIPKNRKVTVLDLTKHHLNPLDNMDFARAWDFIDTINNIYPEGANTLMRRNSNFVLFNALLSGETHLDKLIHPDNDDDAATDAHQKIAMLLRSPILKSVFCGNTNIPKDGVVLVKLDRAVIGDRVAFALASFLIQHDKRHAYIPDFGFYGRDFHIPLIRQKRLTAGIYSFDEITTINLRNALLTIPTKIAYRATFEDAELLANYEGKEPRTRGHRDYVEEAIE